MLLVTRPNHDLITNYLCYWTQLLIDDAVKHKIEVIDLKGKKANAKETTSRLVKQKPRVVLLNGHGNEEMVTGYDNAPLLTMATASIMKGTIVYARSCSSASILGPRAINEGVDGYIGYIEPFVMCFDQTKVHKPLEDSVASQFLEPSNQVIRALLKGHTVQEASSRSKDMSRRKMQALMTSNATSEDMHYAKYIWHNMRSQVCLGIQDAKFES